MRLQVLLGAAAVLSNGTVISRAGSAAVAMMACETAKPVIICCGTYKFHERVQLDSITRNELGDPGCVAHVEGRPDVVALQKWEQQPMLGESRAFPQPGPWLLCSRSQAAVPGCPAEMGGAAGAEAVGSCVAWLLGSGGAATGTVRPVALSSSWMSD